MSINVFVNRKRLTAEQCFDHPWLAQTEADMNKIIISTDKLKSFNIRRKWQVGAACAWEFSFYINCNQIFC